MVLIPVVGKKRENHCICQFNSTKRQEARAQGTTSLSGVMVCSEQKLMEICALKQWAELTRQAPWKPGISLSSQDHQSLVSSRSAAMQEGKRQINLPAGLSQRDRRRCQRYWSMDLGADVRGRFWSAWKTAVEWNQEPGSIVKAARRPAGVSYDNKRMEMNLRGDQNSRIWPE